jgi:hypothetical protein
MATAERVFQPVRSESIFFPAMAVAIALTVFAGFSRTYYLASYFQAPPLSELKIVHGLIFTSWIAVLITQTGLVAAGRRDIHMKLGILGIGLALAMIVVGPMLAIDSLHRAAMAHRLPAAIVFFAIPIFTIATFALMVTIGIANRARPEWHKRFMLLSNVAIIPAAVARIPLGFIEHGGPPVFFGLSDVFIVAMVLYDLTTLKRAHPATLWAGGMLLVAQPLCLFVGGTPTWHAFAASLT